MSSHWGWSPEHDEGGPRPAAPARLLAAAIRARRSSRAWLYRRRFATARAELEHRHGDQRAAWESRAGELERVLEAVGEHLDARFLRPDWIEYQGRIEAALRPRPPFDFLRSQALTDTMVMVTGGRPFRRELEVCRDAWGPARLETLAEEDLAGLPVLHSRRPLTSHTRIHHLYTLARHRLAVGPALERAEVVLEWGGGFGGMGRVLRRLGPPAQTLIVVELPIMCALQWLYLGVTLGPDAVHLVDRPGAGIVPGRVNLVPNGLLDEITATPDLFLSTWALGESVPAAHQACRERGWFDAPHLVIADQRGRSPQETTNQLLDLAQASGAALEPVGTVPASYYAFR